jgi:hypothetical protein
VEDKDGDILASNTGILPIASAHAAKIGLVKEFEGIECSCECFHPGHSTPPLVIGAFSENPVLHWQYHNPEEYFISIRDH